MAKQVPHVAPNNVAICCVDMLQLLGQSFTVNVERKFRDLKDGVHLKEGVHT